MGDSDEENDANRVCFFGSTGVGEGKVPFRRSHVGVEGKGDGHATQRVVEEGGESRGGGGESRGGEGVVGERKSGRVVFVADVPLPGGEGGDVGTLDRGHVGSNGKPRL